MPGSEESRELFRGLEIAKRKEICEKWMNLMFPWLRPVVADIISRTRFHEYFGFTQEEVNRILEDADAGKQKEKVKEWYDGYHFGDFACRRHHLPEGR